MLIINGLPTKFYVDDQGNFLGGFAGYIKQEEINGEIKETTVLAEPPEGAIEIFIQPEDGRQIYNFTTNQFNPLETL